MRIDDLTVDGFVYDFPVWVIGDRALLPCRVYVFHHERQGPTLALYTDEDAALLAIGRAPLAGHVPVRIDDPNELRALADTLRGQGTEHVGLDLTTFRSPLGRFIRIEDFIATIR